MENIIVIHHRWWCGKISLFSFLDKKQTNGVSRHHHYHQPSKSNRFDSTADGQKQKETKEEDGGKKKWGTLSSSWS